MQIKNLNLLIVNKLRFCVVVPPGLEPGTTCPDNYRESQVHEYFSLSFSEISGYFLRFCI